MTPDASWLTLIKDWGAVGGVLACVILMLGELRATRKDHDSLIATYFTLACAQIKDSAVIMAAALDRIRESSK